MLELDMRNRKWHTKIRNEFSKKREKHKGKRKQRNFMKRIRKVRTLGSHEIWK